ncbi:uncharacterized protein LOC108680860 isoform X2 [Hyalella azteca]|uniref:Uncharacterized protein LOC108680860 isoform X2 n=1 Tax=Hyalella azteca TaxID=294128 RepID=A0A8B7PGY6_HYAAZ|nr:uncharacterized protein LOC108680860 isoform X2 [Hyalella azteca]
MNSGIICSYWSYLSKAIASEEVRKNQIKKNHHAPKRYISFLYQDESGRIKVEEDDSNKMIAVMGNRRIKSSQVTGRFFKAVPRRLGTIKNPHETEIHVHHIIPQCKIKLSIIEWQKRSTEEFDANLEEYLNLPPIRQIFVNSLLEKKTRDGKVFLNKPECTGINLYNAICWYPRNLVRGPHRVLRNKDPLENFDTEIFSVQSVNYQYACTKAWNAIQNNSENSDKDLFRICVEALGDLEMPEVRWVKGENGKYDAQKY